MGDVMLNGRRPQDWELAAMERARQCERDRDMEQLAGVLTAEPVPRHEGRPVTDVAAGFN